MDASLQISLTNRTGRIAQRIEHLPSKQTVSGSSPDAVANFEVNMTTEFYRDYLISFRPEKQAYVIVFNKEDIHDGCSSIQQARDLIDEIISVKGIRNASK